MNGRQMAEAARALRPRKVLFIIGYAENAAVGNGHLEPGMQVLTKLFAIDSWPRQNPYVDGPVSQGHSSSNAPGRLRSYVRPLRCGRMTAGPDGLRGSGPKQGNDV
jgi:hypothetical protein